MQVIFCNNNLLHRRLISNKDYEAVLTLVYISKDVTT